MKIVAYTTAGCFYCDQLKELFKRADVAYTAYRVGSAEFPKSKFAREHPGAKSFPHVVIDDEVVGGLVETAKYLMERGLVRAKKR